MEGWQTEAISATHAAVEAPWQLSVLLPAYNERDAIQRVLGEIVEALSAESLHYEILVVDDASTDGTAELAEQFARTCWQCPVTVVRCPERRGAGAARKVGVRAARGEIVVMLDADGTYPAESIPELLRYFPAYDQVNGARTSEQGTLPWLRRPAKWFIRKLACYLTGHKIPDLNTGLKAFKRSAMLPWLWVVPDGFSCVTTMTLAFLTNGHPVKYVPTPYRPRIGAKQVPSHQRHALLLDHRAADGALFPPAKGLSAAVRPFDRGRHPEDDLRLPRRRHDAGVGRRHPGGRVHDLDDRTTGRSDRGPSSARWAGP